MPQAKQVTVYKQSGCDVCAEVVPWLKKLAEKNNVPIKVVDVDSCGQQCSWVKYIPTVRVNGRTVNDLNAVKRMIEGK